MSTSAIGPGFLTQTTTFTDQLKAAFAFAILASIVHVGAPQALGINDLDRPDFGDPVSVAADEVPLFWACGVTPQAARMATRPPFAITRGPGNMLVLDVPDSRYRTA